MLFRQIFLIAIIFAVCSCGGGSAGTGLGNSGSIEGRILKQGQPVPNASVTILETGDSDLTDQNGQFAITVSDPSIEYTLEVQYQDTVQTVPVSANSEGSIINVEIDVQNNPAAPLDIKSLEITAKIVGICDAYFENNRIIRQSNKAPQGTDCTAKVNVTSNAKPVGGARFAVQHKSCDANSDWHTDAVSETSQKFSPGIGQLQFKFYDDPAHCLYRIVVPFETEGQTPVEILIETFTAQKQ